MDQLLLACQIIPLTALLSIMLSNGSEKTITRISYLCSHAMGASIFLLLAVWAMSGFPRHEYHWFTLYEQDGFSFPILFYLDKVSAAYLFCVWTIFAIVIKYCRVYLHRESGYK